MHEVRKTSPLLGVLRALVLAGVPAHVPSATIGFMASSHVGLPKVLVSRERFGPHSLRPKGFLC